MPVNLFIVESPAKCQKIEQYLGPGNKCIASYGHFRELNGLQSINIHNNFEPKFIISENKQSQINKIKKAIKEATEVFLATDDDREGEAIAWHLCDYFELPIATTKRIVFHEVTEPALQKAVQAYRYVNMALVNAQLARQVLDVLVGYKLSPILWKNVKDGTSAGRCQTPALRLVYENYKDIQLAPGKKEYNVTGYFTSKNLPFVLRLCPVNSNKDVKSTFTTDTASNITAFLQASVEFKHVYTCGESKDVTKPPPMPFTTSRLQQVASTHLHTSPKETMAICQRLYEEGYITYMRTDSATYSSEFIATASTYIAKEYGREYLRPDMEVITSASAESATGASATASATAVRAKPSSKGATITQDAHEAIRPTKVSIKQLEGTTFSLKEGKMYALIWSNAVESCMNPALYKTLSASITAPLDTLYKFTTEQVVFPGWKIVNGVEEQNKEFTYLQTLKPHSVLPYKKITAKVSMKELKSHYTEAKLVQLLEERGIGRPSTFSSLIEKIQERGYVKKENVKGTLIKCLDYELTGNKIETLESEREFGNEKNKLVIKPLGIMVIEYLLSQFNSLFIYEYTQHMEAQLDEIAQGRKVWSDLCQSCLTDLEASIQHIDEKHKGKEVIRIDNEHVYMMGKYGPVIKCTSASKAGASTSKAEAGAGASTSKAEAGTGASTSKAGAEAETEASKAGAGVTFKTVKPELDLDKLRKGEYSLTDILLEPTEGKNGRSLGVHAGKEVLLRSGKFGWYIEWGTEKKSLKLTLEEATTLDMDDLAEFLYDWENGNSALIRVISKETSIRKGKGNFDDYIFHKNKKMKKPKFLKLTGFTGDYTTCDIEILHEWLKKTYGINKCE